MKKLILFLLILSCMVVSVSAEDGNVTYDGNAREFIFEPGSPFSPTDLFPDFKNAMPGDVLTQQIHVKNDMSQHVKIKIYLRALGAKDDPVSQEMLSQMYLEVVQDEETVLFSAPADQTAQLTDWVCLGTFYSGYDTTLTAKLHISTALDNRFMNSAAYFDWEFMVEEFPIDPSDPVPPTGDSFQPIWIAVAAVSLLLLVLLLTKGRAVLQKGGRRQ